MQRSQDASWDPQQLLSLEKKLPQSLVFGGEEIYNIQTLQEIYNGDKTGDGRTEVVLETRENNAHNTFQNLSFLLEKKIEKGYCPGSDIQY